MDYYASFIFRQAPYHPPSHDPRTPSQSPPLEANSSQKRTKRWGTGDTEIAYTGHWNFKPASFAKQAAADLSLTWFRAYDTKGGVWLSRDPIGEKGGRNLYNMVSNNTLMSTNVLGLDRYITKTRPPVHHGIAVDIWDENCCKVTGRRYFDFGMDRGWLKRIVRNPLRAETVKDSVEGFIILLITPTVSGPGQVTEPGQDDFPPDIDKVIQSDCEQDKALLKEMEEQLSYHDRYHALLYNRNHWTLEYITTGIVGN